MEYVMPRDIPNESTTENGAFHAALADIQVIQQ
jgi:hypothetical protein